MTKMDMVWISLASLLYPNTSHTKTFSQQEIEAKVSELFNEKINSAMISSHLVSTIDRQADKKQPSRGGSRNRYLFRTTDGSTPDAAGGYRLFKSIDKKFDAWEKTGKTFPESHSIDVSFRNLITWYRAYYLLI